MKQIELTILPHKKIRTQIIKEFLKNKNYKGCVCLSCGNASDKLKQAGIKTIAIADNGDLIANRWFLPSEINDMFEGYLDATSGHLTIELMNEIANYYKQHLKNLPEICYIPSGSGETLVCLAMAFPEKKFVAVYNIDKPTEYDENCMLNSLVESLAFKIIDHKKTPYCYIDKKYDL